MFTLTPPATNLVYNTLGRAMGDSDRFYSPSVDYERALYPKLQDIGLIH